MVWSGIIVFPLREGRFETGSVTSVKPRLGLRHMQCRCLVFDICKEGVFTLVILSCENEDP